MHSECQEEREQAKLNQETPEEEPLFFPFWSFEIAFIYNDIMSPCSERCLLECFQSHVFFSFLDFKICVICVFGFAWGPSFDVVETVNW